MYSQDFHILYITEYTKTYTIFYAFARNIHIKHTYERFVPFSVPRQTCSSKQIVHFADVSVPLSGFEHYS